MDINNYSYSNMNDNSNVLASCKLDYSFPVVFFEYCVNWFGDRFYYVYNIMTDVSAEFHITRYEEAARFYNSLVPDTDCIPLF